jgi:hypothetical protein
LRFNGDWPGEAAFSKCEVSAMKVNDQQVDIKSEFYNDLFERSKKYAERYPTANDEKDNDKHK